MRPIITLDGEHEVNEIWFENVEVPVQNLVGDENRGWTCAKFLLSHERTGIAGVGASKRELQYLKHIATQEKEGGRPLMEDPLFRDRVARVEIDLMALEITCLRVASADRDGKAPGPEASILKIKGTEIQQSLTELAMQAVGPMAQPFKPVDYVDGFDAFTASLAPRYANARKTTIYAGSNEIQRNIISKMSLGL